jgi:hypothetical protein
MMCDYSLEQYKSVPAKEGQALVVKAFPSGTKGFVERADSDCAVCCKAGVEMTLFLDGIYSVRESALQYADRQTVEVQGEIPVIFHSLEKFARTHWGGQTQVHRDGFILSDGRFLSIQDLSCGTRATVTKALPKEITEAAKGGFAEKPEIELEQIEAPSPAGGLRRVPVD